MTENERKKYAKNDGKRFPIEMRNIHKKQRKEEDFLRKILEIHRIVLCQEVCQERKDCKACNECNSCLMENFLRSASFEFSKIIASRND